MQKNNIQKHLNNIRSKNRNNNYSDDIEKIQNIFVIIKNIYTFGNKNLKTIIMKTLERFLKNDWFTFLCTVVVLFIITTLFKGVIVSLLAFAVGVIIVSFILSLIKLTFVIFKF